MTEETIFAAALEIQPDERAAYLAKACGGDSVLRKRLEGLLAASDKAGNFMARPVVASADLPDSATELGKGKSTPNEATVTVTKSWSTQKSWRFSRRQPGLTRWAELGITRFCKS